MQHMNVCTFYVHSAQGIRGKTRHCSANYFNAFFFVLSDCSIIRSLVELSKGPKKERRAGESHMMRFRWVSDGHELVCLALFTMLKSHKGSPNMSFALTSSATIFVWPLNAAMWRGVFWNWCTHNRRAAAQRMVRQRGTQKHLTAPPLRFKSMVVCDLSKIFIIFNAFLSALSAVKCAEVKPDRALPLIS